ncbi:MAG: hypothetical protein QNK37_08480, partial [Acidobacteriota bacterium]|nr:hypothetical protein [Acidobacteriota bacterium]
MWQKILMAIAFLSFIICTDQNKQEHQHEHACGNAHVRALILDAKIDPSRVQTALDEIDVIMWDDDSEIKASFVAAIYRSELADWYKFQLYQDQPRNWPDRLKQREPTMVYQNPDNGECVAFWGGFAYRLGSQFQRSGWFITNLSPHGMDIEHRGNEYHE